jgi:LuxR family maltose regulon positive regulatory protein
MLLTKLHIPPANQNIVHRTELYGKLNTGLTRKLILISAPAGFGKTTLLSDWINQHNIPTAWFSLDKSDNDPVEFLSYIISGIQNIQKEFGESTLDLLKSPNKPPYESITNLLINEIINIRQDFLLVLDDFHLISDKDILELIAFLIEHTSGNIHFVILTRSDPTLPVARLRSQHQLVELRSTDLSFSANDISILFNKKLKLGLSIEDVYSLETKTEGWIAGLQLTALSMQGREDISEFIQNLKGDNRYIMDYLIEEVLKIQSDDIKEFLLQTSVLEQMSAPLCNAVLNRNDSQFILELLEKNNMFVLPLDEERNWYRYHHLFAELLKQRLQQRDKVITNELNNRACEWFEHNNLNELALGHSLEIKNYEKCIKLLGRVAEDMWQNGKHAAILKYGDILPDEVIKTSTEFCLYYSWILISSGQIQKAAPYLASAELNTKNLLDGNNLTEANIRYHKKLHGKISVAFAYLKSHEEHSEKIYDYCKAAMEYLSDDDPLWYSWAWFSYGIAHFSNGNLLESSSSFNNAFEYSIKTGNIYLISTIAIRMAENEQQLGHYKSAFKKCSDLLAIMNDKGYSEIAKVEWTYAGLFLIMGITEFMWADLDRANENIKTAYDLSKKGKDIYPQIFILMVYTVILGELDVLESEKKSIEFEDLMKQTDNQPYLTTNYIGWKIYMLIKKGQIDQANNTISEYGISLENEISYSNEGAYSAYVSLLLVQSKFDEAEFLLSELYALAYEGKRVEKLISLKVYYSILYKLKGNQVKAIANLIEAMEMAADENQLYHFLVYRHQTMDLLNEVFRVHATTKTKIPKKFIDSLKSALDRWNNHKKTPVTIDLSAREIDTLKLIAQDLSNQEIADKLFISLNTVKTHLKNLYLKLEVDNRAKAVIKAKELRMI